MSRDSLLGTFEQLVLLAALQVGEGAYAPAIRSRLEESMGRAVSRGSVYVTLDRLEQRGLLASTAVSPRPGRGGRARRQVAVTADGIAALKQARAYLESLWDGVGAALEQSEK